MALIDLYKSVPAMEALCAQTGCVPNTLHDSVRQCKIDSGMRESVTTTEAQRFKGLERENKELSRINQILKLTSAFFAQAEFERRLKS